MNYKLLLIMISGILFLSSGLGFLLVKIFLRPGKDSDLDNYYWEFEETHPQLKRYQKWSKLTFTGIIISMLLLMLAISL